MGNSVSGRAGEIALKLGETGLALQLFERQISYYEKREDFAKAAEVALKMENESRARALFEAQILVYERKGRAYKANCAYIALRLGDPERAIRYYEDGYNFDKAAGVALSIGHSERAINYHLRDVYGDNHFESAGDIAQSIGKIPYAYELFKKQIDFCKSRPQRYWCVNDYIANLAIKIGDIAMAKQYFEKGGNFEMSGRLALDEGNSDEAAVLFEMQIQKYEKEGDFDKAAEFAEKLKDKERAGNLKELSMLLRFS